MKTKKAKVITAALMALVLAAGTVPASSFTGSLLNPSAEEIASGGWEFSDIAADSITSEQLAVFNNAMSGMVGVSYTPKAVIATQVVAGTNYAFLCESTVVSADPVSKWSIVFVYADPQGNSQLIGVSDIDCENVRTKEAISEPQSGSWVSEDNNDAAPVPESVIDALEDTVGVGYTPIAVLATQLVAGKNYRVLAYGTVAAETPVTSLYVIDVYEDLQGAASLTSITPFDLEAYLDDVAVELIDLADCEIYVDANSGTVSVYHEEEIPSSEYTVKYEGIDVNYMSDVPPTDLGEYYVTVTAVEGSTMVTGSKTQSFMIVDDPEEVKPGSWVFTDIAADNITDDEKAVLENASAGFVGVDLEPVDVIATQVVAGKNYAFLCKCTPVTQDPESHWAVVFVYEDLEGNAQFLGIETIDPADVKTTDDVTTVESGSWTSQSKEDEAPLAENIKEAIQLDGFELSPIAVLGKQIVNGTNYRILAYGTTVVPDAFTELCVLTVYEDLEGNTQLVEVSRFDLLKYLEMATASQEEPDSQPEDDSEPEDDSQTADTSEPDTSSKSDDKGGNNPATGAAAAAGLGAVVMAAAAVTISKKRK